MRRQRPATRINQAQLGGLDFSLEYVDSYWGIEIPFPGSTDTCDVTSVDPVYTYQLFYASDDETYEAEFIGHRDGNHRFTVFPIDILFNDRIFDWRLAQASGRYT